MCATGSAPAASPMSPSSAPCTRTSSSSSPSSSAAPSAPPHRPLRLAPMRARPTRLDRLPEQYFTALLARVAAAAAQDGEPLVDLGRGNPDIGPPPHVAEALCAAARRSDTHGYAPFAGLPTLKE